QPGLGVQPQVPQRYKVGIVRPTTRHRHVDPVNGSGHPSGNGVGYLYQCPGILWLPAVSMLEVAVAEMIAQFDTRRHVTPYTHEMRQHVMPVVRTGCLILWWLGTVPLDGELAGRNGCGHACNLTEYAGLVARCNFWPRSRRRPPPSASVRRKSTSW